MSMRRTITALLLTAALAGLLAVPALAAPEPDTPGTDTPDYAATGQGLTDVTYSGALDPRTGLPAGASQSDTGYFPLRGEEYGYDRDQHCYVNRLGGSEFLSTIPNGAVISRDQGSKVSVTLPVGLTGTLYRGGDPVPDADLSNITETGSYLLEVRSGASQTDSVAFSFVILDRLTNSLAEITLPDGFSFEYVRLNGEGISSGYENYLELLEDGDYEVRWSCPEIGQAYNLSFTLDTVAPTLALPQVEDGQAHSAVTLEDLEPGAYIVMENGGETSTITSSQTVLRYPGEYILTVCDQAGNSTQYRFIIHLYLNLSAAAAIGLLLAGLAALLGYSWYIRKHPRVG